MEKVITEVVIIDEKDLFPNAQLKEPNNVSRFDIIDHRLREETNVILYKNTVIKNVYNDYINDLNEIRNNS